ncbi:hypothetical protein DEI95_08155 [Curtobacterium sp. MCBD17_008]|nr:hypothetical protein DEI95_08155 [Curtobacterium sp. MCBD17_008]
MPPEHQWYPPEFPDVTLLQPVQFDRELAGELQAIGPRQPVWATIEFEGVGPLHLKCFAAAASETAVLVESSWQGRKQDILVERCRVTRRTLQPRRL